MGMVLHVNAGEHRKGKAKDESADVTQQRIDYSVLVGGIMGCVVDDSACEVLSHNHAAETEPRLPVPAPIPRNG